MTFTANTVLTAAQMNVHVRDNMLASEAATITAANDFIISNGYNKLANRQVQSASVLTGETTTSTDYTDLATTGPSVTCETTNRAWVIITAHMTAATALSRMYMSYAITRPTGPLGPDGEPITTGLATDDTANTDGGDRDAGDNWALSHDGLAAAKARRVSYVDFISADLTPGQNTFTCKYRMGSSSVTGTFTNRHIIVIPM